MTKADNKATFNFLVLLLVVSWKPQDSIFSIFISVLKFLFHISNCFKEVNREEQRHETCQKLNAHSKGAESQLPPQCQREAVNENIVLNK